MDLVFYPDIEPDAFVMGVNSANIEFYMGSLVDQSPLGADTLLRGRLHHHCIVITSMKSIVVCI